MSTLFHLVADSPIVIEQVLQVVSAETLTVYPLVGGTLSRDARQLQTRAEESVVVLIEWNLVTAVAFGEACSRLRGHAGPTFALVPSGQGVITALALGADAAHPLPPSLDLLHVQVLAHLRLRSEAAGIRATPVDAPVLQAGPLRLDLASGVLGVHDASVRLTPRQTRVLACFLREPGRVIDRARLLADAWGWDFDPGTNVVDVYVHYLRRRLGQHGFHGEIETVRGHGYRLDLTVRLRAADPGNSAD